MNPKLRRKRFEDTGYVKREDSLQKTKKLEEYENIEVYLKRLVR